MSDTGSFGSLFEELGLQLVGDTSALAGGQLLSHQGVEVGGGGVCGLGGMPPLKGRAAGGGLGGELGPAIGMGGTSGTALYAN